MIRNEHIYNITLLRNSNYRIRKFKRGKLMWIGPISLVFSLFEFNILSYFVSF
ncbi:hypothetical protein Hanom_Chr07g00619291 [Helianthus anomalus]